MRNFLVGTDWWTDCDDVVAMRLLARAAKAGQIRLLGIGVNACMEDSIASLDAFLMQEGIADLPLGLDHAAVDFGGKPSYQKNLAATCSRCRTNADAADAAALYRRMLAQAEGKVEIIEIGFPQVLSAVLESRPDEICALDGVELFRQKVDKVWVMAGKWDEEGGRENNFCRTRRASEAAEIFCRLCPSPITFLGWEVGCDVITGSRVDSHDPLYKVLCDHGSQNGRMSWDPMLALMALTGSEEAAGYHTVRGRASVRAEDGANFFEKEENGPHGYVIKQKANDFYRDWIDRLIG